MRKNKNELSFKYAMFWFLWGLVCWIIGQIISNKSVDIFFIITMSISTLITAPLSYSLVNKNFKEINFIKFCFIVVPLYILFMILIGVVLYLYGFLSA